jgi:hypothetical protein
MKRVMAASLVLNFVFVLALALASSRSAFAQDAGSVPAQATPGYTPKYHGDPARSDSEFAALAYMRAFMRAQVVFNKHYGHYATALPQLVHSGNFTQRMVNPDRGDYMAGFRGKNDSYVLIMTPKTPDAQHRSFYATDDGKIHAEETKAADGDSPVVETHRFTK